MNINQINIAVKLPQTKKAAQRYMLAVKEYENMKAYRNRLYARLLAENKIYMSEEWLPETGRITKYDHLYLATDADFANIQKQADAIAKADGIKPMDAETDLIIGYEADNEYNNARYDLLAILGKIFSFEPVGASYSKADEFIAKSLPLFQ